MRGDRFLHHVGATFLHDVGDRAEAVRSLVVDFDRTYADIGQAIGILPYEGSAERVKQHPAWYAWWVSAAEPLFRAWRLFKAQQLGGDTTGPAASYIAFANRWETDWPEYEKWHANLSTLRASAANMGIKLATPAPAALPTTTAEDVAHVVKDFGHDVKEKAGETWTLAKIAIYGGLGVAGLIAITSLVSNLRSGSDPVVEWRKR